MVEINAYSKAKDGCKKLSANFTVKMPGLRPPACPLHRPGGMGKAPSPGVGKGAVRVCYHSPAGLTGAFLVTVRETVSSSTASAGSSLAITT